MEFGRTAASGTARSVTIDTAGPFIAWLVGLTRVVALALWHGEDRVDVGIGLTRGRSPAPGEQSRS
jgi:hypothetical protein